MDHNVYTEEKLSTLIRIAKLYIEEPEIRDGMVSKFYQEIGNILTGAPPKTAIEMNQRELKSLKAALLRGRKAKSSST